MATTLRLLSYNVRSLRDSVPDVVRVIRACRPHVVCVQEAPRFLFGRTKCRRLAAATGLELVTGGRAAGAMLLLARPGLPVTERRNVLLPRTPGLHQRGLAIAAFRVGDGMVAVASMHLGLTGEERLRHVPEVVRHVSSLGHPVLLAGDVNEEPGAPAWSALAERYQDGYAVAPAGEGPTYSAAAPRRRIDGVFVDPRLTVQRCGVPALDGLAAASDHRPVLADVEVPGG